MLSASQFVLPTRLRGRSHSRLAGAVGVAGVGEAMGRPFRAAPSEGRLSDTVPDIAIYHGI